ncbi:hypothetical protein AVEN_185438-1 [Araneus ventricosus]|uniref:Uncharacterized protein n=1 Tax=Araneus ventricosus TaxID=182803 RepID=A0A4Y2INK0_ARAVE|nr:hypothetical protein AVEN_185438-1 [Araneus ventricosus]
MPPCTANNKGTYIHLRAEWLANRSRTVRRNYFHGEPIVNHGKGASSPQTINHRLSVTNGAFYKRLFGHLLRYELTAALPFQQLPYTLNACLPSGVELASRVWELQFLSVA